MNDDVHRFVFLTAVTFDHVVGGRTRRLAEVLAAAGHAVSFVEMPTIRRLARPWSLLRRSFVADRGIRVVRLPPLPWSFRARSAAATRWWSALAIRAIRRLVPGAEGAIMVTSTPWWLPVVRGLPAAARCYDHLDHVDVQAGPKRTAHFRRWDDELLSISDVVTTVSEPLRQSLASRVPADRLHLVPNGVCQEWLDVAAAPVDRRVLTPRPDAPIAGFLGALFEWVDLELLARTARALPEMEFAIVGPGRRGVSLDRLRGLPNLHCHGPVGFDRVPATIAAFDVCLIPFRQDLVSAYADPLKVYEYCALGKPVVSTVRFNAGGAEPPIRVAHTPESFATAIREALADSPAERARRVEFARRHTWEARAQELARILAPARHAPAG